MQNPTLFGLCIERLHRSNSAKTARRQAHSFGLGHNAVYKSLKDLCTGDSGAVVGGTLIPTVI